MIIDTYKLQYNMHLINEWLINRCYISSIINDSKYSHAVV